MNVGAVINFWQDMAERRSTLARLQTPEAGFCELPDGTWVWRCVQEPLASAVQAPSGSAVVLAGIFGLPFVRLRAALPEALFAGAVGQALGRRTGLSVNGLAATQDENFAALSELLQNFSCFGAPRSRIPNLDFGAEVDRLAADYTAKGIKAGRVGGGKGSLRDGALDAPEPMSPPLEGESTLPRSPEALAEEMVGTALVLAFMENTKVLPVVELARRLSDARARFRGATLAAVDHDFDALHAMFLVMLSPGNLSSRGEWLETSRLWRFILLQRSDGSWDSSQSLAFALQAHEGARPPPPEPRSLLRRVLGALFGDDDLDDALDDAIDEALTSSDDEDAEDIKARAAAGATPLSEVKDCPLSFSQAAIRRQQVAHLVAHNYTVPLTLWYGAGGRLHQHLAKQRVQLVALHGAAKRGRQRLLPTVLHMIAVAHGSAKRVCENVQRLQFLRAAWFGTVGRSGQRAPSVQEQLTPRLFFRF